jgi:hypothetical protein
MGWMVKKLEHDFWQGQKILLFSTASRLAGEPAQPPVQWAQKLFPPGMKLITCLLLVPRF